MTNTFREARNQDAFWGALRAWHTGLKNDRGQRAELRRCKTLTDVFTSRAFWRGPVPMLRQAGFELDSRDWERLALPLGVLAWAETLDEKHTDFPVLLARDDKGSENVRDVRFRKLLSVGDNERDALYDMLRRLVRLLRGKADLRSLVEGAYYWNDQTRRWWAEKYYSTHTN